MAGVGAGGRTTATTTTMTTMAITDKPAAVGRRVDTTLTHREELVKCTKGVMWYGFKVYYSLF